MSNIVLDPYVLRDIDPLTLDFPIFLELYCHWMGWEASWPQIRMAEWLQETEEDPFRVLHAYRGAAKSTVTSLYTPWRLSRDAMWTVLMLSATQPLVDRNSRFIRSVIEDFPLCAAWQMKPDDPDLWKTDKFTIRRPRNVLNPSVAISSILTTNTGLRAKTLLMDDVEVQENVETQQQREKLRTKVRQFSMINSNHLFIGTPHSEDTIYRTLEESKNNYVFLRIPVCGEYVHGVYVDNGFLANPDTPLDGQVHDEDWIQEKRNDLTDGEFNANFLLIPSNVAQSLLKLDLVHVYGDPADRRGALHIPHHDPRLLKHESDFFPNTLVDGQVVRDLVAFWDPSSAKEGRDDSVLALLAMTEKGDVYVLHVELLSEVEPGQSFDIQCEEVLNVISTFGLERVCVESNFSPGLAGQLKKCARRRRRRVSVKPVHATGGRGKFKAGISRSKPNRIARALEPVMKTGFYVHHNVWHGSDLRQQMIDFPGSKKDDILDAIAWAIYELRVPGVEKLGEGERWEKAGKLYRKGAHVSTVNRFDPLSRTQQPKSPDPERYRPPLRRAA